MRKLVCIILVVLLAVCCSKDEERLAQLERELAELQGKEPSVPGASEIIPPEDGPFAFAFDAACYGVDAGQSVSIKYSLPAASSLEINTKDGWTAVQKATSDTEGEIVVTAPDPASPTEIVATATTASGRSTAVTLPVMLRDPYSDATRPRIDALGYYSFKPWNATPENFRKLADAGLNMVTVETGDEGWQEQIICAGEAGLKVLPILIDRTWNYYNHPDTDQSMAEAVNWLKNRPEVFAYHMFDEPGVSVAPMLKMVKEKIEELDPTHPVYVNFGPEASTTWMGVDTYYEYVNTLADYLDLKQLSFDIYPIYPGRIQSNWHKCLEIMADAAKRHGVPLWTFAASCWINKEQPIQTREKPNKMNILLQLYTSLAFGSQLVQYFTIQDYGGTDFAPIMRDGTWTQAYDYLKDANLEMQKRAFVFKGSNVTKVRQAGEQVSHEMQLSVLDLPEAIEEIYIYPPGSVTVSFLENNGNRYIALVNNYWSAVQQVRLVLNEPVYCIDSEADFTLLEPGENHLEIPMGGMMVLKIR